MISTTKHIATMGKVLTLGLLLAALLARAPAEVAGSRPPRGRRSYMTA